MIVTTIGLSSLLMMPVHSDVANASRDEVKARFYAPSVADLAVFRIAANANWSTEYTNDQGTTEQTVGELEFRYKLVDQEDGGVSTISVTTVPDTWRQEVLPYHGPDRRHAYVVVSVHHDPNLWRLLRPGSGYPYLYARRRHIARLASPYRPSEGDGFYAHRNDDQPGDHVDSDRGDGLDDHAGQQRSAQR